MSAPLARRAACPRVAPPRLFLGLSFVGLLLCAACTSPDRAPKVERRTLFQLPQGYRQRTLSFAEDGTTYAYATRTDSGQAVVFNGKPGHEYTDVTPPVVAPKSGRLAYWARSGSNVMLVDGDHELQTELARNAPILFSKNGRRWATAGITGKSADGKLNLGPAAVYSDGRLIGQYADATAPALSPDGLHLAFIIERDDGKKALIVDGVEKKVFTSAAAATAAPAIKSTGRGELGLRQFRVLYLSDGSLVTLAQDSDGWAIHHNDTRLASFANVVTLGGEVSFSFEKFRDQTTVLVDSLVGAEAAPVLAWWERQAGPTSGWRVSRHGEAEPMNCAQYWEYTPPLLSRDGKRVFYPCLRQPPQDPEVTADVVVDRQSHGTFTSIWGAAFSEDSHHVAYAASPRVRGDWHYYRDGRRYPITYDQVWRPRFSPDSKHLAWEAERGKRAVLVVDGDSLFSYDEIVWGPQFPQPNVAAWIVLRGRRVIRVEAKF